MKKLLTLIAAAALAACSAQTDAPAHHADTSMAEHHGPHILSHDSAVDFDATLAQLRGAIDARGFKTFAVIDHGAGAQTVDVDLRPTTLVIFGNPKGGAPVMQAEQLMGLELPLKMLVTQNADGLVTLSWRDMEHTFHEYGIGDHPAAEKMSGALAAIAEEAGR